MNRLLDYQEQQRWEEEEHYLGGYEDWLAAHAEEQLAHEPKPIPCDPCEEDPILKGRELFSPVVLATILNRNRDWLQRVPRTTAEVTTALFPSFDADGMSEQDLLATVSDAMFAAGFAPSDQSLNPTWTFPV
jgi:hypothetical protein